MSEQLAIYLPLPATSEESRDAGDRGIERARRGQSEWLALALEAFAQYAATRAEVTVEDFRAWWASQGGSQPRSHHAWGAVGQTANRRGLVRFLRFQPAKSVATHGHPIRVYTRA